jgi:flagellin
LTRTTGEDAIVSVNGAAAYVKGLEVIADIPGLQMSAVLTTTINATVAPGTAATTSFDVTGGGMKFQLGADTRANEQKSLGIQSVFSTELGTASIGYLSEIRTGETYNLTDDPEQAVFIVDEAISDVTLVRSRLGAFQKNTLDTNVNSVNIAIENLASSESRIRDTDFAVETAEFTKAQILVQAGTAVLAQANLAPQSVLQLLG